jgi:hypothetical protein
VARSIARGRTNTEIAAELFISLSTVKSHLASIQGKLGVRNPVEIAAWAWETGLAKTAGGRQPATSQTANWPPKGPKERPSMPRAPPVPAPASLLVART